ncbi:hypothetical protein [Neisseria canis]|uniref:Lipoprotein n=1 Tax=Neisseria canis TaxID=493 RepID=A0A3S4QCF8_9NEIS|nr:hypothetical protein [Neisseria canis]VEF03164.1 Uncharacterised protein [Neisseria canis]
MRWQPWWAMCRWFDACLKAMEMKKYSVLLCAALLLAACTSGLPKPARIPQVQNNSAWFQVEQRDAAGNIIQTSLLAVEQSGEEVRFVQTNPLGAPVARQVLSKKGWHNDGFVMPNAASRRLFGAMLPLFSDNDAAVYPQLQRQAVTGGECYKQRTKTLWCTVTTDRGWLIDFPGQTQWSLFPIQE